MAWHLLFHRVEDLAVCQLSLTQARRGNRACSFALLLAALVLTFGFSLRAQSADGDSLRRIKSAVTPEYSALAKRLNLSGVVKVSVLIAPDGKVKDAHVIGGHPVLAVEAEKAALQTRFEPGPKETTQVIEFRFGT
jgi:TonB family protein